MGSGKGRNRGGVLFLSSNGVPGHGEGGLRRVPDRTVTLPTLSRRLEPGETWTGEAHLIARQEYWDQAPWEREAGLSAVPPPRLDSLRKTKIFQRQPSPARGD